MNLSWCERELMEIARDANYPKEITLSSLKWADLRPQFAYVIEGDNRLHFYFHGIIWLRGD